MQTKVHFIQHVTDAADVSNRIEGLRAQTVWNWEVKLKQGKDTAETLERKTAQVVC